MKVEWFVNENFWKDMYDWLFPPERFEVASQQVEKIIEITGIHSGNVLDLCCGPARHTYEETLCVFRAGTKDDASDVWF